MNISWYSLSGSSCCSGIPDGARFYEFKVAAIHAQLVHLVAESDWSGYGFAGMATQTERGWMESYKNGELGFRELLPRAFLTNASGKVDGAGPICRYIGLRTPYRTAEAVGRLVVDGQDPAMRISLCISGSSAAGCQVEWAESIPELYDAQVVNPQTHIPASFGYSAVSGAYLTREGETAGKILVARNPRGDDLLLFPAAWLAESDRPHNGKPLFASFQVELVVDARS